jgi:hypothetical protein
VEKLIQKEITRLDNPLKPETPKPEDDVVTEERPPRANGHVGGADVVVMIHETTEHLSLVLVITCPASSS